MLLVNEILHFQMYCTQKHCHLLLKKCEELKAPHNFSAKNITAIDFVSTVRLNKPLTNDFVKLMILKTMWPRYEARYLFFSTANIFSN